MKYLLLSLILAMAPFTARAETGITKFAVSGPIMVLDGNAYWGANFSAYHGVTEQFDVGGETGFYYHSSNSVSTWVIPIVPTGLYHFDIGAPTFKPFVGLGLGVGITHASVTVGGFTAGGTHTNFEGLVHLGATIGASQQFFGDIKLGLLDDNFVFNPTIGWFF